MGSVPATVNQTVVTVNSVIKSAIENIANPLIESAAIADFPWLGLPIIRQIFHYFLGFIGDYFYIYTANATVALIIDMQINGELSAASQAIIDLQSALNKGDQLAIQKASNDFDKAMADLIHWDGSI